MKNIIIATGGTAGHALPAVEVGKALMKNHRIKLLYIGSNNGPEKQLAINAEIPFKGIVVGKRRAYFSIQNFIDIFKIIIGIIQTYFIFIRFKPNLIFAKGGYVAYPVMFWAKHFKIPLIIHESDVIIGKANLTALKYARKICLGFPINYVIQNNKINIPLNKMIYTGTPLRKEFYELSNESVTNKIPKLLITGGSQGSSKINKTIFEILPELLKKYEIFHLSGKLDYDNLINRFGKEKNYHVYRYSDKMPLLQSQADLIISRASANTLAEISCLGKSSILIPLASASQNHQSINALIYQNSNAAVTLSEKNLTSSALLSIINRLMEDSNLRQLIGHHAREFSVKNSTSIILDLIYEEI